MASDVSFKAKVLSPPPLVLVQLLSTPQRKTHWFLALRTGRGGVTVLSAQASVEQEKLGPKSPVTPRRRH